MEAIIESQKGSDAIIGVEMTHMGQTVHKKILIISFLEINVAPLGVIYYNLL